MWPIGLDVATTPAVGVVPGGHCPALPHASALVAGLTPPPRACVHWGGVVPRDIPYCRATSSAARQPLLTQHPPPRVSSSGVVCQGGSFNTQLVACALRFSAWRPPTSRARPSPSPACAHSGRHRAHLRHTRGSECRARPRVRPRHSSPTPHPRRLSLGSFAPAPTTAGAYLAQVPARARSRHLASEAATFAWNAVLVCSAQLGLVGDTLDNIACAPRRPPRRCRCICRRR
jgi:hypothetical protein